MSTARWGDFEVNFDRIVGRGGTSTVYLAQQVSLERPCVVKVLKPRTTDESQRDEILKRFQNEAKLIAQVRDPRVVQVLQAGENDGKLWIAMELVNGKTLSAVLNRAETRS